MRWCEVSCFVGVHLILGCLDATNIACLYFSITENANLILSLSEFTSAFHPKLLFEPYAVLYGACWVHSSVAEHRKDWMLLPYIWRRRRRLSFHLHLDMVWMWVCVLQVYWGPKRETITFRGFNLENEIKTILKFY